MQLLRNHARKTGGIAQNLGKEVAKAIFQSLLGLV
jgi:hypothetical protein